MAVIQTIASGVFSSPATWQGGIVPGSGDTAVINHPQTWDTSFVLGGLTYNANVTTSGTGLTFGFAANAVIASTTVNVNVVIGAGNTVAGVQGSPAVWTIGQVYAMGAATFVQFAGSSGSHCSARDVRFTWDTVHFYAGGGTVRATWTDFLRCGDATHNAIYIYLAGYINPVQLYDCTFNACGPVANNGDVNGVDTIDIQRCVWLNTASTVNPLNIICTVPMTTGTRNVSFCVFDRAPYFAQPQDFTIADNAFLGDYNIGSSGYRWASFRRNLARYSGASFSAMFSQSGDMIDSYLWMDGGPWFNPHVIVPDTLVGDLLADGLIFDCKGSDGQGDVISPTLGYNVVPATCMLNQGASYVVDDRQNGPFHMLGTTGTAAAGDIYYMGWSTTQQSQFGTPLSMTVYIDTASVGTFSLAWEYWNGTAWTALPGLVDATAGLTVAGHNFLSWTTPTGWATTVVNGVTSYWIRARVASLTGLTTTAVISQMVMSPWANPIVTYTARRCIVMPGRDGKDVGTLFSLAGGLNNRFIADHNTDWPESQVCLSVSETYRGYPGMVASFRANLVWADYVMYPSSLGFKYWDGGFAIIRDIVAPANADYNAGWNLSTTKTGATWATNQGRSYIGIFSSTPGVHDVDGVDPQFFDKTRNVSTWDVSLGGDGSSGHILAQFQSRDPRYTVSALLAYVRAGYAPQATAYKNASYPGDPIMADIGAVPVVGVGVTQVVPARPMPPIFASGWSYR